MHPHTRIQYLAFFLGSALAIAPARAQSTPTSEAAGWLKQAGILAHQQAKAHVPAAARQAVSLLESAHRMAADDAEILAYLGSANAMVGRDGDSVFEKLRRTNRGLELLDQAVRLAPRNVRVRMIRGGVSFEVPAMFHRQAIAAEDYRFVVDSGAVRELAPDVQAEVFYKLGSLSSARNERQVAAGYFSQAQAAAPRSSWAARAAAESKT